MGRKSDHVRLSLYVVTEKRIVEADLRDSMSRFLKCELPIPWYRLSHANNYRMYFWNMVAKDVRDLRQKLLQYQFKHKEYGVLLISHDKRRRFHKCC